MLPGFVEPLREASAVLRESDDPLIGLRAYVAARIRIAREHPCIAEVSSAERLFGSQQSPAECRDCCTPNRSAMLNDPPFSRASPLPHGRLGVARTRYRRQV
ncbi:TetR family transcriptional regulator C-terminal domain-containing protein [Pseudomonas sp. EA_65y_Pfl2_P78]|uniref:TetR family transcriptional regulator C-terminal domain-containing protein n=1 Tax=Pseudomonas sp. EA_65y_Pfl2_P78 TaxID=3088695 RepID=UPI0030DD80FC